MNRYENQTILINKDGRRYLSTIKYPQIPLRGNDVYIYPTMGDRLDKLALTYYKDSQLWWVISIANNLPKDSLNIPLGIQIRIPQNLQNIMSQFRQMNDYD